jgi:hypothetical protein
MVVRDGTPRGGGSGLNERARPFCLIFEIDHLR